MRRISRGLLLLLGLQLVAPMVAADGHTQKEQILKAVFIYNFAKFTTWPEGSWPEGEDSLRLCTFGKDEVVRALQNLTGKRVKEHPLLVQPVASVENAGQCHLIYIANSKNKRYAGILKAQQGRPVLTVSELPEFARKGGIVQLYREAGRIRFTINLQVARESGLVISSRLLSLAELIDNQEEP